jgi:ankyrin repeat protein
MSAESALLDASRDVDLAKVTAAVEVQFANLECTDPLYKRTPLAWAVYNGLNGSAEAVVQYLTLQGAKVDAIDCSGNTPLHEACKWGYERLADFLLKHGASKTVKNADGKTASELAEDAGHVRAIAALSGKP